MNELRDLYQEVILDHNNSPKNFRAMASPSHEADGHNPLCGDTIHIYLKVKNGVVDDISFQGHGCAISKASASLMTAEIKARPIEEIRELFQRFQTMVTQKTGLDINEEGLGKLIVLAGVREFPARIKCATLAWHTLIAALENKPEMATTE